MFTKVSVLTPTRHRLQRLETMLTSYETTALDTSASEVVFRVDEDDEDTQAFLARTPYRMRVGPRGGGYATLSQFFNDLVETATGDVLMFGNDDMIFRTPKWSTILLETANQYPDGLFDLGVTTLNETHYPFACVSRRVVECLGFLVDPEIFWGDIYLRDVMGHFGRCVMIPQVHIDHDWVGFRPDKVFAESMKDPTATDPTYWSVRHRDAVLRAIATLEPLYADARVRTGAETV